MFTVKKGTKIGNFEQQIYFLDSWEPLVFVDFFPNYFESKKFQTNSSKYLVGFQFRLVAKTVKIGETRRISSGIYILDSEREFHVISFAAMSKHNLCQPC